MTVWLSKYCFYLWVLDLFHAAGAPTRPCGWGCREWKMLSQTRPPVAFRWGEVVSGDTKNAFWIWCFLWDPLANAPHLLGRGRQSLNWQWRTVLLLSAELPVDTPCCFCWVYLVRTTDWSREEMSLPELPFGALLGNSGPGSPSSVGCRIIRCPSSILQSQGP